ncbi:MAG: hypothetical protein DIU78_012870 [Pseudomonadota bacterium]
MADWLKTTEWDTLYLGGAAVPCAVAQVEVKLPSGLDIKKSKGRKKATLTDDGDPPAKVRVKFFLLPRHLEAFKTQVIPLLRPRGKSEARPPVEIGHPNTAFWGITAITPGELTSPMPARGGMWVVEAELVEWCPAPPVVKKPPKEKPKDVEDRADWSRFAPENAFRHTTRNNFKPSSEAAKKL